MVRKFFMNAFETITFQLLFIFICCVPATISQDTVNLQSQAGYGKVAIAHRITSFDKYSILNKHNELRGKVKPSAANMRLLTWDEELATNALAYSRKCPTQIDTNISHSEFNWVGENIYISENILMDEHFLTNVVQRWFDENVDFNYVTKTCAAQKVCGHYTQVAWASTYAIGCGMTTCKEIVIDGITRRWATVVVCDYIPGGNFSPYLYEAGAPCSKCAEEDVCDDNLCHDPSKITKADALALTGDLSCITFCLIVFLFLL